MSDVPYKNIPWVPIDRNNRASPEYGIIFRLGHDRDEDQLIANSKYLGYIIDTYKGRDGHQYYLADWLFNFKLPTKDHEIFYAPCAIRDDEYVMCKPYFKNLISIYEARRKVAPTGALPPPQNLVDERNELVKKDVQEWNKSVPGFVEYNMYLENIRHNYPAAV